MIGRGNRILKPGDEFGAEGVAPAGSVEFPPFGDLGLFVRDLVERPVTADAKVFRPVIKVVPHWVHTTSPKCPGDSGAPSK